MGLHCLSCVLQVRICSPTTTDRPKCKPEVVEHRKLSQGKERMKTFKRNKCAPMLVQLWSLVLGHTPPYEVGLMDKENAGWLVVGNMRLLTRWLGLSNYLPT